MTVYDDAELAAIAVVRLAASESPDRPPSREMIEVAARLKEAHAAEDPAIEALIVALARFGANTARVFAEDRGGSVEEFLDDREMFKLGRHFEDEDEDEPPTNGDLPGS